MRTTNLLFSIVFCSLSLAVMPVASFGQGGSPEQAAAEYAAMAQQAQYQAAHYQAAQAAYVQGAGGDVVNAGWLARPGMDPMVHPVQYQQAAMGAYGMGGYDMQADYMNCQPGMPGNDEELWGRVHRPVRYWAALDFVGLSFEGMWTPALATAGPPGAAFADAGVLPDATVLFGNDQYDDDIRGGAEVRLGYWLVDGQFTAIEGYYLGSETASTHFRVESTFPGGQILGVPFYDNGTGEDANVVAYEGVPGTAGDRTGSIDIDTQSDFQSGGILLRHVLWADFEKNFRIDMIGGYRFAKLDESLIISQDYNRPANDPTGFVASNVKIQDVFDTENEFHGGEIGLSSQWHHGCWTFDLLGKVALGNNHEVVEIRGQTTQTLVGGSPTTTEGGTLTAASNIGRESRNEFAIIPELGLKLHFQLLSNVRLSAGYRVLYINEAVRPGQQIDRVIGGGRPTRTFQRSSIWMNGFDGGLTLEY